MESSRIPVAWCRLPGDGDGVFPADNKTPLIVDVSGFTAVPALRGWVESLRAAFEAKLAEHGAVLLRGGPIADAADFEAIARALVPDLAARPSVDDGVRTWRTACVWEADGESKATWAAKVPLGLHDEAATPRRLLFGCLRAPGDGGEIVLVDHRRVPRADGATGRFFDALFGAAKSHGRLRLESMSLVLLRAVRPALLMGLVRSSLGKDAGHTPVDDWRRVRAAWDHSILLKWRRGDVLFVDNHALAHGRMPFRGARDLVAAMSATP